MLLISDPRKKPLRTSIVILAIASTISLFIVLSSLSTGIRDSSREAIDRVGADVYVVPESLNPLLVDLQSFDQGWAIMREISQNVPSPTHISPRLKDTLFIGSESLPLDESLVYGIDPDQEEWFKQFELLEGSWFSIKDDPIRDTYLTSGVIDGSKLTEELLISEGLKKRTGLDVGDVIHLSARIGSEEPYSYIIKGTFLDSLSRSSESMLMHLGELQFIKGLLRKDTLTEILLDYEDDVDLKGIISWSESDVFLFNENVDLYQKEDLLSEIYKFISVLDGFSIIVISVTLIVCLIFTSTIFMISTKQRSIELSVLRAIGFHPFRIFYFVIREAFLYYLVGTSVGLILGAAFNMILNYLIRKLFKALPSGFEPFTFSTELVLMTLALSFILSILSAMVPALISARRSPIRSIRGGL